MNGPDPLFDLHDRRVVVTGAARGIGHAIATTMLERGARVEIWDLPTDQLAESERELAERFPGHLVARGLDVSDGKRGSSCRRIVGGRGARRRPRQRGRHSSHRRPAVDIDDADWARMLAVNLGGPWNTCRTVGRAMMARGRGSVIKIASTNSIDPSPGIAHYCVSRQGWPCSPSAWRSSGRARASG